MASMAASMAAFASHEPERAAAFAAEVEAKREAAGIAEADLPPQYVLAYQRAREYAAQWQERYAAQRRQQEEIAALAEAQARNRTIHLCSRLYVGGVGFELGRDELAKVFEPFGYVKNVDMTLDTFTGRHKGFCFVEYEAPEAAAVAITVLNGAMLGGRALRVGRPNNFPADAPNNGLPLPVPERIYVANIHPDLSEADIQGVFEAFGAVKQIALLPDAATRKHKSYGYIQYEAVSAAEAAVLAMNGFDLGGRRLTVTRTAMGGDMPPGMSQMPPPGSGPTAGGVAPGASTGAGIPNPAIAAALEKANQKAAQVTAAANLTVVAPPPGPVPAAATVVLPAPTRPEEPLTAEENVSIRGNQRYEIMQRLAARTSEPQTSKSIILRNMVTPEEVDDELEGEITEECGKFGTVQRVVVFVDSEDSNPETAARIFVTFATAEAATRARDKFEGRFFAGRRIKSALYDDARLLAKDYSG